MAYDIDVQVQLAAELPLARLREAATWVLADQNTAPGTGLSIVITDDASVQALNKQFRAVDAPTDVLSFPADPVPPEIAGEDSPYLGDLVLALPYIQRQAEAEGHALVDELVLAVVHGTLHLLGYDHADTATQNAMWTVQARALAALGVAITVPLFSFDDDE